MTARVMPPVVTSVPFKLYKMGLLSSLSFMRKLCCCVRVYWKLFLNYLQLLGKRVKELDSLSPAGPGGQRLSSSAGCVALSVSLLYLCRSWTPAKCIPSGQGPRSGGALQGVQSTRGNICEQTTIFWGFLKKVNLMWVKGISWKTAPRREDKNCSFLARVSRALAEHREVARHTKELRSPGAQEPVGLTGGGKRNTGGSL